MPGLFGGIGLPAACYDALKSAFTETWGTCECQRDRKSVV